MKISEMLEREDFYSILQSTLETYSLPLGFTPKALEVRSNKKDCSLFVNPKLNAIMPEHPSQAVVEYLQTEYRVGGSWQRRMAVKGYLWLATHFVKRFSQKGIQLKYNYDIRNLLIYPCNKKIRVFDFGRGIVYTVLKEGFPDNYILREVAFRQREAKTNNFIPNIKGAGNGFYAEEIIHGRPLARINDNDFVENKKRKAYQLILSLTAKIETINSKEYINRLADECDKLLHEKSLSTIERKQMQAVFDLLANEAVSEDVPLVVSHGDLQPGNIWIEDKDEKIIIIDWETVKSRSPFYDLAALHLDMRRKKTPQSLYDRIIQNYSLFDTNNSYSVKTIGAIVLAEELAYQTEELSSFPGTIGIKEYKQIVEQFSHLKL